MHITEATAAQLANTLGALPMSEADDLVRRINRFATADTRALRRQL